MPEFKDMLKFYRIQRGLSQSELADKLGIAASTISMYEVGKREPDFENEEKIADFFNVNLDSLRGRDTESMPPVDFYITEPEKLLIEAYRKSDMKAAIDTLLKLNSRKE